MLEFFQTGLLFLTASVVWTFVRLAKGISYPGDVPRFGEPGIFGYLKTAIRYTFDAETVISEGREKYSGKPFAVPTLSGPVFLLGPGYYEIIRSSTDDNFNQPLAVSEDLQLSYTMDPEQIKYPYHVTLLTTTVNRAIPSFIPEILDESTRAITETLGLMGPDGPESVSLPLFETMTHLVARINNRVIFGTELCRNEDFIHAIVRFAETTPLIATLVTWCPNIIRRPIYVALSSLLGGKRDVLKFIVPFLTKYMKERKKETLEVEAPIIMDFFIEGAPPHETVEGLAMHLININFGSIHTSSIFTTQTLFEMVSLPRKDLAAIREEIIVALESEGGWTKGALLKFRKLDSALREIGRFHGLMQFGLPRYALRGLNLPDDSKIPPGHRVALDMKAFHFDPDVYPDPHRCDLFRFSKLRESEETDTKYGFSTVDAHYLPFSGGRHACPGRFFAAMELKITLAHLLLNYDFALPPGVTQRPANTTFNGAIIPDPKAQMVFSRRKDAPPLTSQFMPYSTNEIPAQGK
ncbi:cytochrome P450 [Collybia nuda]|uniref:Cytochrome P450 n=1 Tax=Collybia nuda TaxID=64659 RepID=A0A9P6CNW2_9AGAR|nr:cytochrome P450 [Collybia nuda]